MTNPAFAGFVVCGTGSVDEKAVALSDLCLCHGPASDGVVAIAGEGDLAVGVVDTEHDLLAGQEAHLFKHCVGDEHPRKGGPFALFVDTYIYDSAGNRITHTDVLGQTEKTWYDTQGRVVKTVSAMGATVTYDYAWSNTWYVVGSFTDSKAGAV